MRSPDAHHLAPCWLRHVAAKEGATLRLRPILMTMLVATLSLLPAALSHDIGSDSKRPFPIVIVGGLLVELVISVLLLPTMYVYWARPGDRLPRQSLGSSKKASMVRSSKIRGNNFPPFGSCEDRYCEGRSRR